MCWISKTVGSSQSKERVSVDNSLEAHRYYVRKTAHAKFTEPLSVAEGTASRAVTEHFFMAGIRE